MKKLMLASAAWGWLIAAMLCACNQEENTGAEARETLYVDIERLNADSLGGSYVVNIESNATWTASLANKWLSVTPATGKGSQQVTIACEANHGNERTSIVTFSVTGLNHQLKVVQAGPHGYVPRGPIPADTAHLVSYRYIPFNQLNESKGQIELTFDQPVGFVGCDFFPFFVTTKPTQTDNNRTLRMPWCGEMGDIVNCSFTVVSYHNVQTTVRLSVPICDRWFCIGDGAELFDLVMTADESAAWIAQYNHAGLRLVSLSDGSVLRQVDLPFEPGKIVTNPYNGLFYVLPTLLYVTPSDNRLCIVDPTRGAVVETITFEPAPFAHPVYPTIYPTNVAFTNDGFGLVVLVDSESSGYELRMLDSADGHRQTLYEEEERLSWRGLNNPRLLTNPGHDYIIVMDGHYSTSTFRVDRQHPGLEPFSWHTAGGEPADPDTYTSLTFHQSQPWMLANFYGNNNGLYNLDTGEQLALFKCSMIDRSAWDYGREDRNCVFMNSHFDGKFYLYDLDQQRVLFMSPSCWKYGICAMNNLRHNDELMVVGMIEKTLQYYCYFFKTDYMRDSPTD